MRTFFVLAAILGLASSAAGLWAAFAIDLPPAPCVVMAAALAALPGCVVGTRR